jgi:hypothetical protein
VNDFVEECRREWRRLGVPDPIANEMAADLSADIVEAESEGGSAEDVLGNSVFDPRRFAASWATSRGVASYPVLPPPPRSRAPWVALAVASIGVLAIVVVFVVALFSGSSSVARVSAGGLPGMGQHSSSDALPISPIAQGAGVGPLHLFGFGSPFAGHQEVLLALLAMVALAVVTAAAVALAVHWLLWPRRGGQFWKASR